MAKILLIEDEADQTEMIKIRLGAVGYKVIVANNAKDGIKLAQEEKPDLILMDMILPGMHGLEATIKLKENPESKEIPIIALTAMSMADFKQACFQEGICAFIKKPYEPAELIYNIEKNIREKRKRTEITKKIGRVEDEPALITKKKILIIDDEPDFLRTLSLRLMSSGFEVTVATDAVSGVKQAHRERPDLILLDIVMPAGGGHEAFENLKKSHRTMLIPIILISGYLSPKELEEKAIQLGAQGFIHKPFDSKELIAKAKEIFWE